MCTYNTEKIEITGSGKGAQGWFALTDATVYFDHPVHAMAEHTLNIDFRNPANGPAARVAVELTLSPRARSPPRLRRRWSQFRRRWPPDARTAHRRSPRRALPARAALTLADARRAEPCLRAPR